MQGTLAGGFEPLFGISLGQAQDSETSAIFHLGMGIAGEDRTNHFCGNAYLYLYPMTMESGPDRCSTLVFLNPASFIQWQQSAPV